MPFLISAMLWREHWAKAQAVWYIDNESACLAMIKGSGEAEFSALFNNGSVAIGCREQSKSWFARVPSFAIGECCGGRFVSFPNEVVFKEV